MTLRFLVIDDNRETLALLEKVLSNHGECTSADSGKKGIEEFELGHSSDKPYHLIILDIMMPEMDGHEVLKTIRRLEEEKYSEKIRAKVAMLTALGSPKSRFASYEEGCERYFVKPIIKSDIVNLVDETREWFDLMSY